MAKTATLEPVTEDEDKKVVQVDIKIEGAALVVPEGMPLKDAIASLTRRAAYEDEVTDFTETVDCFPQDGAVALYRVMRRRYGWAQAEVIPGNFFTPDRKPQMVGVEVGPRETIQVPWGRFTLPKIKGWIETTTQKVKGRMVFGIHATVLRKFESDIKAIADDVREEVRTNSIFRGKSLKLSFTDESNFFTGNFRVAQITFLDVDGITGDSLVFSDHVMASVMTNLITPLDHYQDLQRYGIPYKRGVLLAGVYGTGKTLAAFYAANRANANGITFVYVERSADFAEAVTFGRQYQPSVVFCEDIDRVTSGDRDASMDEILNIVDGIDSKTAQVMTVLTTNEVTAIHQGMLRPGRLDAIIEVEPPDALAVQRLIRLYGRDLIAPETSLVEAGRLLQGQIPAVIREVVERAKLAAIRLGNVSADGSLFLTDEALVDSAHTMRMQISLLNRKPQATPTELEQFGRALGAAAGSGLGAVARSLARGERAHLVVPDGDGDLRGHNDDGEIEMEYGEHLGTIEALPQGALAAMAADRGNGGN